MVIQRYRYLQKLIDKKENGLIKVITGLRRCGKSYLLFDVIKKSLDNENKKYKKTNFFRNQYIPL